MPSSAQPPHAARNPRRWFCVSANAGAEPVTQWPPDPHFQPRVDLLTEEDRRIRAGPRRELLRAAAVHRRGIDVALLIHAHPVDAPEGAGEITPHAPR